VVVLDPTIMYWASQVAMQVGAFVHGPEKVTTHDVAELPVPTVIVPAESFPIMEGEVPHKVSVGVVLDISIFPAVNVPLTVPLLV
jgi:hypothetical protein